MGINKVNNIMDQDDYYSYDEYYSYDKRNGGDYRKRRRTNKLTFYVIGIVIPPNKTCPYSRSGLYNWSHVKKNNQKSM